MKQRTPPPFTHPMLHPHTHVNQLGVSSCRVACFCVLPPLTRVSLHFPATFPAHSCLLSSVRAFPTT